MTKISIEHFLEAANKLDSGFAIYNKDLSLVFANEKLKSQLPTLINQLEGGASFKSAVREQTRTIMPDMDEEALEGVVHATYSRIESGSVYEIICEDGSPLQLNHSRTEGGIVVGITTDLSYERERTVELKAARKAAEAASQAKSEFLAAMSHEIRTPLNGILGMAQALSARDISTEERDMVSTILESSKSLMTILNDILDLSKIEAGKLELSPVDVDIRHKLTRLQKFYQPIAEEKGLYFKLVVDPTVPSRLKFDPVRMRQGVSNLISNALKFTASGGVIVAVKSKPVPNKHDSHMVTVHVSDTGIGISDEARQNLFTNFSQADRSTTRQYGGTGLGLAITKRLATIMGGSVNVISQPNKGSVFSITFEAQTGKAEQPPAPTTQITLAAETAPQTMESVAPSALPKAELTSEIKTPAAPTNDFGWIDVDTNEGDTSDANKMMQRSKRSLKGLRVLIVDDNAINRRVARLLVEPQGVVATEAENGQEALDMLGAEGFDLVLLDMHMPVMDGRETIKSIRASSLDWHQIPVIALTADAMSGDREKCLALGMDGYVPKPVDQRELFSELLSVMAAAAQEGRVAGLDFATELELAPETSSLDDLFERTSNG